MEVSGQFYSPAALTSAKAPGTHCIGGCVSHRAGLHAVAKRKKVIVHAGNRTLVV